MDAVDIKKHSKKCEIVFAKVIKNSRFKMNTFLIEETKYKLEQYEEVLKKLKFFIKQGSVFKDYLDSFAEYSVQIKDLLDNMDDKFLLFVVGTGNYGKSTLINALMQQDLAPIDFRPKTWKIDVYYLDEKNEQNVIIKLNDGQILNMSNEDAHKFIENEEKLTDKHKKEYNNIKNEELKKCKTKKERDEMQEKLKKEYLYKSKVVEIRWPVKQNKFLKNILLVDTPGISQDLLYLQNSIKDYYFKADGVIWMLDGLTIASKNNNEMIKELESYLGDLGGLNDNIIGVVNKIDKVYANGGKEAVDAVMNDANNYFGDKFKYIIPISAKEAFNNPNDKDLENLNAKIEDTFLSDANSLKLESKKKGIQKIVKDSIRINKEFESFISLKNSQYQEKYKSIQKFEKGQKEKLEKEVSNLVEKYLEKVSSNIIIMAGNLFDIRGENESKKYVLDNIFELNKFQSNLKTFISNKEDFIKIQAEDMYENAKISKYKYISKIVSENISTNLQMENLNLKINQSFNIYTSLGDFSGEGLLNALGGVINQVYKGIMKMMKINSVRSNLSTTINKIVEEVEEKILKVFNENIDKIVKNSFKILEASYMDILFDYNKREKVCKIIEQFNNDIFKEKEIKLKDIL